MPESLCKLCHATLLKESEEICEACQKMEIRINYLIENHKETAKEYLGKKFNQASDPIMQKFERRGQKYQPPKGTHTPDRRMKIRRLKQVKNSPKKRKTDHIKD
jgi:hypothetical protein